MPWRTRPYETSQSAKQLAITTSSTQPTEIWCQLQTASTNWWATVLCKSVASHRLTVVGNTPRDKLIDNQPWCSTVYCDGCLQMFISSAYFINSCILYMQVKGDRFINSCNIPHFNDTCPTPQLNSLVSLTIPASKFLLVTWCNKNLTSMWEMTFNLLCHSAS